MIGDGGKGEAAKFLISTRRYWNRETQRRMVALRICQKKVMRQRRLPFLITVAHAMGDLMSGNEVLIDCLDCSFVLDVTLASWSQLNKVPSDQIVAVPTIFTLDTCVRTGDKQAVWRVLSILKSVVPRDGRRGRPAPIRVDGQRPWC